MESRERYRVTGRKKEREREKREKVITCTLLTGCAMKGTICCKDDNRNLRLNNPLVHNTVIDDIASHITDSSGSLRPYKKKSIMISR